MHYVLNKDYPLEARSTPKNRKLSSAKVFWARLPSRFGQLGLISDPQISSRLQNKINDPKGLENKIYTITKGRETFYSDHTVPIISCSENQYMFYKRVTVWNHGLHQRTENCCMYKFSGTVVFVVLLFYVHGKHLRSCRDGQLT